MPQLLAFVGLIIGVALYWLLVRRRVFGRVTGIELGRVLSASNQVALTRIRDAPRRRRPMSSLPSTIHRRWSGRPNAAPEAIDEAAGVPGEVAADAPAEIGAGPSRQRLPGWSTLGSLMTYEADPRVDAYIDALPDWQQGICRQVRDLVHAADPEVVETIKRTRQPYFVLDGNICALLAAKDHVNVFVYDGGIVPDPEGIITAGHDNKTARTVAFREGEPINAPALTRMFKQIIANNRAGGWRKLKGTG